MANSAAVRRLLADYRHFAAPALASFSSISGAKTLLDPSARRAGLEALPQISAPAVSPGSATLS
jgi:hypothetical protein